MTIEMIESRKCFFFTWHILLGYEHSFDWINILPWFSYPTLDYLLRTSPFHWSLMDSIRFDFLGENLFLMKDFDWTLLNLVWESIPTKIIMDMSMKISPFCCIWSFWVHLVLVNSMIYSFDSLEFVVDVEILEGYSPDWYQYFVKITPEHNPMEPVESMMDWSLKTIEWKSINRRQKQIYNHFFVVELEIDIPIRYDRWRRVMHREKEYESKLNLRLERHFSITFSSILRIDLKDKDHNHNWDIIQQENQEYEVIERWFLKQFLFVRMLL